MGHIPAARHLNAPAGAQDARKATGAVQYGVADTVIVSTQSTGRLATVQQPTDGLTRLAHAHRVTVQEVANLLVGRNQAIETSGLRTHARDLPVRAPYCGACPSPAQPRANTEVHTTDMQHHVCVAVKPTFFTVRIPCCTSCVHVHLSTTCYTLGGLAPPHANLPATCHTTWHVASLHTAGRDDVAALSPLAMHTRSACPATCNAMHSAAPA